MGRTTTNSTQAVCIARRSVDMGDMLQEARVAVEFAKLEGGRLDEGACVQGASASASALAAAAAADSATHACIEAWKAEEAAMSIVQNQDNQAVETEVNVQPQAATPQDGPDTSQIPDFQDTVAVLSAIASVLVEVIDADNEVLRQAIYYFFAHNYQLAQWSSETNIAGCVLLLRWCNTGYALTKENWRKTMLIALMITQKITDDVPLGNREFTILWQRIVVDGSDCSTLDEIVEPLSCDEVNALERNFLSEINYQAFINSETMIEVYHELMSYNKQA